MEFEGGRRDDQTTEPPDSSGLLDGATPGVTTSRPGNTVDAQAPDKAASGIPSLQTHFSTDSGVVTDEQADPSLPNVSTDGQHQQQQPQQPLIEAQLAEEQELVPDVRRIPKRHRRRRRWSVSHKYVLNRKSTATQLSGATRA